MNGALVGFLVAVGGMSAFIFALSSRMERRRAGWGSQRRRVVPSDGDGGLSSNSDTWSFSSWFSGTESFSSEHHGSSQHGDSCNAWDRGAGGSWDSGGGGGGDCGGGGGGDSGGGGGSSD
jgi:hypothetical protein